MQLLIKLCFPNYAKFYFGKHTQIFPPAPGIVTVFSIIHLFFLIINAYLTREIDVHVHDTSLQNYDSISQFFFIKPDMNFLTIYYLKFFKVLTARLPKP